MEPIHNDLTRGIEGADNFTMKVSVRHYDPKSDELQVFEGGWRSMRPLLSDLQQETFDAALRWLITVDLDLPLAEIRLTLHRDYPLRAGIFLLLRNEDCYEGVFRMEPDDCRVALLGEELWYLEERRLTLRRDQDPMAKP